MNDERVARYLSSYMSGSRLRRVQILRGERQEALQQQANVNGNENTEWPQHGRLLLWKSEGEFQLLLPLKIRV